MTSYGVEFQVKPESWPYRIGIPRDAVRAVYQIVLPATVWKLSPNNLGDFKLVSNDPREDAYANRKRVVLETIIAALATKIGTPVQSPPEENRANEEDGSGNDSGNEEDDGNRRRGRPRPAPPPPKSRRGKSVPRRPTSFRTTMNGRAVILRNYIFILETLVQQYYPNDIGTTFDVGNVVGFRFVIFVMTPEDKFMQKMIAQMMKDNITMAEEWRKPKHPLHHVQGRQFLISEAIQNKLEVHGYDHIFDYRGFVQHIRNAYSPEVRIEIPDACQDTEDMAALVNTLDLSFFSAEHADIQMERMGVCREQRQPLLDRLRRRNRILGDYGQEESEMFYQFALPICATEINANQLDFKFFNHQFPHRTILNWMVEHSNGTVTEETFEQIFNDDFFVVNGMRANGLLAETAQNARENAFVQVEKMFSKRVKAVNELVNNPVTRGLPTTHEEHIKLKCDMIRHAFNQFDPTANVPDSIKELGKFFAKNPVMFFENPSPIANLDPFLGLLGQTLISIAHTFSVSTSQMLILEMMMVVPLVFGPDKMKINIFAISEPGHGKSYAVEVVMKLMPDGVIRAFLYLSPKSLTGDVEQYSDSVWYLDELPPVFSTDMAKKRQDDQLQSAILKQLMTDGTVPSLRGELTTDERTGKTRVTSVYRKTTLSILLIGLGNYPIKDESIRSRVSVKNPFESNARHGRRIEELLLYDTSYEQQQKIAALQEIWQKITALSALYYKSICIKALLPPPKRLLNFCMNECMDVLRQASSLGDSELSRRLKRTGLWYSVAMIERAIHIEFSSPLSTQKTTHYNRQTNKYDIRYKKFDPTVMIEVEKLMGDNFPLAVLAITSQIDQFVKYINASFVHKVFRLGCNLSLTLLSQWVDFTDYMLALNNSIHRHKNETTETYHPYREEPNIPSRFALCIRGNQTPMQFKDMSRVRGVVGATYYNCGGEQIRVKDIRDCDRAALAPVAPSHGLFALDATIAGHPAPLGPPIEFMTNNDGGSLNLNYVRIRVGKTTSHNDLANHVHSLQMEDDPLASHFDVPMTLPQMRGVMDEIHNAKIRVPCLPVQWLDMNIDEFTFCSKLVPSALQRTTWQSMNMFIFRPDGTVYVNVFAGLVLNHVGLAEEIVESMRFNMTPTVDVLVWVPQATDPSLFRKIHVTPNHARRAILRNPNHVPSKIQKLFPNTLPSSAMPERSYIDEGLEEYFARDFYNQIGAPMNTYGRAGVDNRIRSYYESHPDIIKAEYPADFFFHQTEKIYDATKETLDRYEQEIDEHAAASSSGNKRRKTNDDDTNEDVVLREVMEQMIEEHDRRAAADDERELMEIEEDYARTKKQPSSPAKSQDSFFD